MSLYIYLDKPKEVDVATQLIELEDGPKMLLLVWLSLSLMRVDRCDDLF